MPALPTERTNTYTDADGQEVEDGNEWTPLTEAELRALIDPCYCPGCPAGLDPDGGLPI